ncbi:MAG: tRNA (guanine-N1)-methyltransferase [Cyanobacteria bacterium J06597_16]
MTSPAHSEEGQTEGAAKFRTGSAFFRSSSQTGRDLAILAAIAHKATLPAAQPFRVLDAMTGCGVRPLRYALEAQADYVWANEGNHDLYPLLSKNLGDSLPATRYRITHQNANAVFFDCYQRQDFYDLIDIDGFGSPMPTLSTALWAVKLGGLLYLTSTDGRATSGHAPNKSLQTYGAYARAHPAVHEQGLRLLIGAAIQQAAARGLGAQPVFSFYNGEVNRVMVRITQKAQWKQAHYGFLAYCHGCGQFQTVGWKKLARVACVCPAANSSSLSETVETRQGENPPVSRPVTNRPVTNRPVISGPMWLGPLHNHQALEDMRQIAIAHQTSHTPYQQRWKQTQALLETMQAEATLPPYYYPLAEIGRRGKMDIPPRDELIAQIRQSGFQASRTHLSEQAIKTDCPLATVTAIALTGISTL